MSLDDSIRSAVADTVRQALAEHTGPQRVALTVAETAQSLGCSPDLVRRLIERGQLPTVPTGTRRQLVPVDALRRFANSGSEPPDAQLRSA